MKWFKRQSLRMKAPLETMLPGRAQGVSRVVMEPKRSMTWRGTGNQV
jgi:hypothetical protein